MAIVEARRPDGRVTELVEVNLTKSGLLLMITDCEAKQVLLPVAAWEGIIKAVEELIASEKRQAQAWMKEHRDESV